MLPRKSRLPLRKEFPNLQTSGHHFDSPSFGLTIRDNDQRQAKGAQAAFIISKKVDSRSVVRHEVKRKLSEVLAPLLSLLPPNTDMVLFVKKRAVTISQPDLKEEMEAIFKNANLLTTPPAINSREKVSV